MKRLIVMAGVAALCGAALADGANPEAEGGSFALADLVSVEAGVDLDSRYITYGVIDGKDPIATPNAQVKFLDWLYFGVESIFDVTKANGKRGEYGNRAGRYTLVDGIVGVAHDFELCEEIGALSVDFNYIYEYVRRYRDDDGVRNVGDTQYLNLEFSLGDLWLEPTLSIERDLMADDGTYVNFSIGHSFPLIDGESDDPVLAFRPSVGQGFGNTLRVRHYGFYTKEGDELDHGGLMDTTFKGELTWNICEHVSLTGYVAYSDYLFDSNMREGAREHNVAWGRACDHSWNFYGGIALGVSF